MRARQIMEALEGAGIAPTYVEQTGGGTATIYCGTPDDDGYYLLAIGPGEYDYEDASGSRFDLSETVVGTDGEYDYEEVTNLDDLVKKAVFFWTENLRRRFGIILTF